MMNRARTATLLAATVFSGALGGCSPSATDAPPCAEVIETKLGHIPLNFRQASKIERVGDDSDLDCIRGFLDQVEADTASAVCEAANIAHSERDEGLAYRYIEQCTQRSSDPQELTKVHYLKARMAWERSDHQTAIKAIIASLDYAERTGDASQEMGPLRILFNVLEELGSVRAARAVVERMREVSPPESGARRRLVPYFQGALELRAGNFSLAAREFEKVVAALDGTATRAGLRGLYLNLADAHLGLQEHEQAKAYLAKAWVNAEQDGSRQFALRFYDARVAILEQRWESALDSIQTALQADDLPEQWPWQLHYYAGNIAEALNQPQAAIDAYQASTIALEKLGTRVAFHRLKAHLLTEKRGPYEALFLARVAAGDTSGALEVIDRVNGRAFTDAHQNNASLDRLMLDEITVPGFADGVDQMKAFLSSLETGSGAQRVALETSAARLQHHFVLFHFLTDKAVWVATLKDGKPTLVKSATVAEFERVADQHLADPEDVDALGALGDILFPQHMLPRPGEHLHVVPDPATSSLALPAAIIGGQHLVQRVSLSFIPNLTFLVQSEQASSQGGAKGAVLVGDPLQDLPAARTELETLNDLLAHSALFVGPASTTPNLREIPEASVVHFATHSGSNAFGPWLQMADQKLSAWDVVKLVPPAELAVLASCASATPDEQNLWGSLAGVFLAGGSRNVVAATRPVEDAPTRDFVLEFYAQATPQKIDAASALAHTQRRAIAEGQPVRDWASFILLGAQ